jgi:hypothetical protein
LFSQFTFASAATGHRVPAPRSYGAAARSALAGSAAIQSAGVHQSIIGNGDIQLNNSPGATIYPSSPPQPSASDFEGKVAVDCTWRGLPSRMPPSGNINYVQVNGDRYVDNPNIATFGQYTGNPGDPADWKGLGSAARTSTVCRFINFGPSVLMRLYVEFPVTIQAAEKSGSSNQAGAVLAKAVSKVLIAELEPGGDNSAWVYFYAYARNTWAWVDVPHSALAWVSTTNQPESVRLRPPTQTAFSLPPLQEDTPAKP